MGPTERPNDVIRRSKQDSIPGLIQFPKDLGAHSMLLVFSSYKYKSPGSFGLNKANVNTLSTRQLSAKQSVLLPLPTNIEETFSVDVRGYEAGLVGTGISGAASALGGDASNILDSTGKFNQGFINSIKGIGGDINLNNLLAPNANDAVKNIAFVTRKTADTYFAGASRAISSGLGNINNPKQSLYFDGVTLKQPSFNWTFAPQSADDSDTLRSITNLIKRNVLPAYDGLNWLNRAILKYPSVVDIFFLGIDQSYFLYYKTCMVNQFAVNYAPNGLAFVKGGKPAMITMQMQMIEADIHTANDYGAGDFGPPGDAAQRGGAQ